MIAPPLQSFFWILFAHGVGDMGLQTCYISKHKHEKFNVLFAHCVIWAGCVAVALRYLGIYETWKMAFLISAHFITDFWSSRAIRKTDNWQKINTIDQAFHFMQLLIVYFF